MKCVNNLKHINLYWSDHILVKLTWLPFHLITKYEKHKLAHLCRYY